MWDTDRSQMRRAMNSKETCEEARRAIARELDRMHRKHLQQENDQPGNARPISQRLMHRLSDVRLDRYFT